MNNLKKTILVAILLISSLSFGQNRPDREKIKSLKVAFITESLDLSSKEAQAFWPIYNQYEENREALRQKERTQIRSKIKSADELSEKAAKDLLEKYISFEDEEEALDKAFLKKVSVVISAKKTLLLLRSEEEFKRQLISQYRHKKGGGGF
jgi:Skp family chaperone for outer membrane proteins